MYFDQWRRHKIDAFQWRRQMAVTTG